MSAAGAGGAGQEVAIFLTSAENYRKNIDVQLQIYDR